MGWFNKQRMLLMECLLVLLLCVCVPFSHGLTEESNDIESLLNSLDIESSLGESSWGIPDTRAIVGRLFKYTLPGATGDISVSEAGKDSLPDWLEFDTLTNSILGVPSLEHLKKQFYLELKNLQKLANSSISLDKDIFSVTIDNEDVHTAATPVNTDLVYTDGLKPIKCKPGSSVTTVTIIVDTNVDNLKAGDKVKLVKDMASHLDMPTDLMRLFPLGSKPMFDSSALVAGPGDAKTAEHPGATLQWEVGCGNVQADHMPILTKLESSSADGTMGKSVGHAVVGWHVTNNKPTVAPKRLKRRAVYATQTLQMSVAPPSQKNVATEVVSEPVREVVPTAASPVVPEIKPTKPHKHRHTRTKKPRKTRTKKKKKDRRTRTKNQPKSTMVIQPTRVQEVVPTAKDTDMEHPTPAIDMASPGISRTLDVLEPSVTPPLPSNTEATEILPTPTLGPTIPEVTDEPIKPTKSEPTEKTWEPRPIDGFNLAPIVKNKIPDMTLTVGTILYQKIPANTFEDPEDGDTRNLKLNLLTKDDLHLTKKAWMKIDKQKQVLYGIPLNIHEGRHAFNLVAIDSEGVYSKFTFAVYVEHKVGLSKISHEMSMRFDGNYDLFIEDVDERISVANKLAALYGDSDPSKLTVTRLEKGSVIYAWTNNSLPTEPCPTKQIDELANKLVHKNKTITYELKRAMFPYIISEVASNPKGACLEEELEIEPPYVIPPVDTAPVEPEETDEDIDVGPSKNRTEEILVTTVIPAVLIAAVLLIAAIVACVLYRKKRNGKLSDEDHDTFIKKGTPVIFASELEERPDPPTKPLILADEKPPLPPPEYPRSRGSSTPSSPLTDHKDPLISEDERDDVDLLSPPYRPPPPVPPVNGNNRHRPYQQPQHYRNPQNNRHVLP